MNSIQHIQWKNDHVRLLDQTLLPQREVYLKINTVESMAEAIQKLRVRGAPAIGIAAAYGLVLSTKQAQLRNMEEFKSNLHNSAQTLLSTRPTAINLSWSINRMLAKINSSPTNTIQQAITLLTEEALVIHQEDKELCEKIGKNGASIFTKDKISILTHCNAGSLATGGQGTALGVIHSLKSQGKNIQVFADETRPLLQGARLTTWELQKVGIPVTLICDNAATVVMEKQQVDAVIVGADRIAANGDTANKIGTFTVALAAKEFGIPFYVAAPYSTFDSSIPCGDSIPIEQRDEDEVTCINNVNIAPRNVQVYNPAFDITPNRLITAFITDRGIIKSPFLNKIKNL